MTTGQKTTVLDAIAECTRFIDRESKRAAHLRPAEMVDLLAYYISHRQKLIDMLAK